MKKRKRRTPERATPGHWEHFSHGADIGIRGMGASAAAAFEQAALAMTAAITDPAKIVPLQAVKFECEAPDLELLLMDWLNALVFEMATRGLIFGAFEVRIDGNRLHGLASGEPVDVERHEPAAEIKGATVTQLAVTEEAPGAWRAQCVLDV
jgi:SHS2 domain-containing protein